MACFKDSDCPAVVNAVPRLSSAAKLETCPCGQELCFGVDRVPSREVGAGGHSKGYSLPCKSRGTMAWGDVRSHLAHGNKDTVVASVCLPGDVPYAGGSPQAAHTAPGCSVFTSLSSFCAVGSTWHMQVQAGTYPTRPSLILGCWRAPPNPTAGIPTLQPA